MTWFRTIWSDRLIRAGLLISAAIILAHVVVLIWVLDPSAQAQALHYNIYFGVDVFGSGYSLWLNPAVSFAVLVLNTVIAVFAIERQVVAARLSMWASVVFSAVVLAGTLLLLVVGVPS